MSTVLVAGGAGYIGSHVCKALAAAGFTPVVYDNLSSGHRWAVRWGPLEIGDIRDEVRLVEVMRRYRPAAALHFAALIAVGESVVDPGKYYSTNVAGSISLLNAMRSQGVDTLVFSSTAAVYGVPQRQPIDETQPRAPVNPYGWSKAMVEQIISDHAAAHDLRWAALRYFNACGADPEGESGEEHDPEFHLIPRALMAGAGKLPHLDLFGTDYPTPDGTCIRDYIHVADLASAHVTALRHLLGGGASVAANLGVGRGFSVREVIAAVEAATGLTVPVRYGPRREGDPPELVADPGLAMRSFGFAPRFTDLTEIVATAWNWHRPRWMPS
ncbi:MAG: UDP-glucose 4-epimerase GalE [Rhodospirillaceae bacterium]